ncbi:MAG: RNA polymerase sigma factor SigJ [Cohnella sp.]|nr:RNA polymerase sigma factor SigJ [Cohnella sp.]
MVEALYKEYGSRMMGIAYRMLGSVSDAEDAVQDVFERLASADPVEMQHPRAYLAKLTTNRCLNILKSARRRREQYVGPWLPEPIVEAAVPGPEEQLASRDDVSYAWLVMLERLTPAERAVYVMRESFGYEYGELAKMLDKTEVGCRKLYSRAAAKLKDVPRAAERPSAGQASVWMRAFLKAARDGDFGEVTARLAKEAMLVSDGGGKVRTAIRPIYGSDRVAAFFEGLFRKGSLSGEWSPVLVNGQPGLVHRRTNHTKAMTVALDDSNRIVAVYWIQNPDKLVRIRE